MIASPASLAALAATILLAAFPAAAAILVAARTIPVRTVLAEADLTLVEGESPGALGRIEDAVGQETRVPIYAGRPVRGAEIGPAAVIERNETVVLRFHSEALLIEAEGRALDRAGAGDGLRVMNLSSRMIVMGRAVAPGIVQVGR